MPIFEKRKRKNDENHNLWSSLISAFVMILVTVGLALFFIGGDAEQEALQTNRIGLFVGHHYDDFDMGAVCDDGLTERSINSGVAESLADVLTARGYTVDIFHDYGGELDRYRADLLLSLHVQGCADDIDSGYRVVNANDLNQLNQCLSEYESATDLERLPYTAYMNGYYSFPTTAESTPVLVIELGMLEADREILTTGQAQVVAGLANTIKCFSPLQDQAEA